MAEAPEGAAAVLRSMFEDIGEWFSNRFLSTLVVLLVFIFTGKLAGRITTLVLTKWNVRPQRASGEHFTTPGDPMPELASIPILEKSPALADMVAGLVTRSGAVHGKLSRSGANMAGHIVTGLFYIIGIVMALQQAGLALAPVLAASAVVAFTVSIALKDVLGNTFSGMVIMLYDTVRPGDFLWLPGGPPDSPPLLVAQVGLTRILLWQTADATKTEPCVVVVPPSVFVQSIVRVRYSRELPKDDIRAVNGRTAVASDVAPHMRWRGASELVM